MVSEFMEIFQAEKPERGSIGARNYALSVMITKRRASLAEHLDAMPTYPCFHADEVTHMITKITAQLTLLVIERGA